MRLSTGLPSIITDVGGGRSAGLSRSSKGALAASSAYLAAMDAPAPSALQNRAEPITSLVPSEPGEYADLLKEGESKFRAGKYVEAFGQFKMANYIGQRDPESLLSMAHARFATGYFASAAFYIRDALIFLPELPLAPLRPKAFYGDPSIFIEHLIRLEDHVRKHAGDAGGYLLLAYFRWFREAPDVEATRQALSEALKIALASKDTDAAQTVEAVETFWDGILATGRASGKLMPTTRPAAETAPSDKGTQKAINSKERSLPAEDQGA